MKTIDAQGKTCPVPLIMTKKALDDIAEDETLIILIDNETSVKNVTRFLEDHNIKVHTETESGIFRLTVNKTGVIPEGTKPEEYCCSSINTSSDYLIAFMKNTLGGGDDELGTLLIKAFINTLPDIDTKPGTIVFLNSGIFLTLKDSPVLESLKNLEKEGIKILVCGTCLDFYQKKQDLGTGIISNMYDILHAMSIAGKVLFP